MWLDVAFLGCLAYVVVETVAVSIAGVRGHDVRGRVIVYLLVMITAVILGLALLTRGAP